jgi:uncharacterized membrane protein
MSTLSWCGLGSLLLLAAIFCFVRRVPVYLVLSTLLVAASAALTFPLVDWSRPSEWILLVVGLFLWVFGLLIVRVMLIRSVSLHLLATIFAGKQGHMVEDIGGRLGDMRAFGLIRTTGDVNELTSFGRLISGIVALFYFFFRTER